MLPPTFKGSNIDVRTKRKELYRFQELLSSWPPTATLTFERSYIQIRNYMKTKPLKHNFGQLDIIDCCIKCFINCKQNIKKSYFPLLSKELQYIKCSDVNFNEDIEKEECQCKAEHQKHSRGLKIRGSNQKGVDNYYVQILISCFCQHGLFLLIAKLHSNHLICFYGVFCC